MCQIGQVIEHVVSCDIISSEVVFVVFVPSFHYTCFADVEPLQVLQAADELDVRSVEVAGKRHIDDGLRIAYQFGQRSRNLYRESVALLMAMRLNVSDG